MLGTDTRMKNEDWKEAKKEKSQKKKRTTNPFLFSLFSFLFLFFKLFVCFDFFFFSCFTSFFSCFLFLSIFYFVNFFSNIRKKKNDSQESHSEQSITQPQMDEMIKEIAEVKTINIKLGFLTPEEEKAANDLKL